MYDVEFSNSSKKFLVKTEKEFCARIIEKIEKLSENPFPQDCKRVEGRKEKVFRIKVGKYRIMYVVFQEQNKLFVSEIAKRSKIYDD